MRSVTVCIRRPRLGYFEFGDIGLLKFPNGRYVRYSMSSEKKYQRAFRIIVCTSSGTSKRHDSPEIPSCIPFCDSNRRGDSASATPFRYWLAMQLCNRSFLVNAVEDRNGVGKKTRRGDNTPMNMGTMPSISFTK